MKTGTFSKNMGSPTLSKPLKSLINIITASSGLMITCCIAIICLILGCGQPSSEHSRYADIPRESIEKGMVLAEKHCTTCHRLPDPSNLDAETWENGALPAMGPMMGIFSHAGQSYPYRGDPFMKGPGYLAGNPTVTPQEWEHILNYYTATAPALLPTQDRDQKISLDLSLFQYVSPGLGNHAPLTSFVKIRDDRQAPLVISDALTNHTYFLNDQLQKVDSLETSGPLVNINFDIENEAIASNVGVMEPSDGANGEGLKLRPVAGHWVVDSTEIFKGLHRPMQISPTDLNADQRTDYLICEFGYMQGGLLWMENLGDKQFQKHVISDLPGASKAYPVDFDQDGRMDVVAMFAQGEEGIYLYLNRGDGQFEEQELLNFPALYGSSHFELADFNQDGRLDILYTAGDNADYTSILKPYHGVYIFLNKAGNTFEQAYFFPINGCYKAMANDFDKDGDLDLAAIAYYADFASQPEEGFVYLENQGDLQFTPSSSVDLQVGRWISMDIGDIDNDGWTDIVLGNFVQASSFANPSVDWGKAPPVMILKNKGD